MKIETLSNELDRERPERGKTCETGFERVSEQLCCEVGAGTQKNELGIGGAAKRFRSVAEEWRRKPEPRKARGLEFVKQTREVSHLRSKLSERPTPRNIKSGFVRGAVYFCAGLTLAVLLFMIGYILVKGVPFLRGDLFSWRYTSENWLWGMVVVINAFAALVARGIEK